MNTFFFGYLALKWRRLTRTLIILLYIGWIFMILQVAESEGLNQLFLDLLSYTFMTLMPVIPIVLISWVLKPFIVKD